MYRIIDIPTIYYIIAVVVCVVNWLISKKPTLGLLIGYVVLVIAETLLIRQPFAGQHFQPELFWSWKAWDEQREQIIANVVMFIPVGILGGLLWKWRGLWLAVGLSAGIEVTQLITSRGLCEFDDVIHNVIGTAVGIGIVVIVRQCLTIYHRMGD